LLPSNEVFKTIILPMVSIAMIPVLVISSPPGSPSTDAPKRTRAIQDSKDIMEYIENEFPSPSAPLVPSGPKRRFISMLLELLADEWLVVQAMYWRWSPEKLKKQQAFLDYEFGSSSSGGRGSLAERMAVGRAVRPHLSMLEIMVTDLYQGDSKICIILPWPGDHAGDFATSREAVFCVTETVVGAP
jgi:glutathione S-transferase